MHLLYMAGLDRKNEEEDKALTNSITIWFADGFDRRDLYNTQCCLAK